MPTKLNLDIFSTETVKPAGPKTDEHVAARLGSEARQESELEGAPSGQPRPGPNNPGPKFVPVGFYPRHLSLLDDAVLKLRRSGHWRASKSAIIRNLIEANAEDLDRFGRRND